MTAKVILATAAGIGSATGGVATGVYFFTRPTNIKELLIYEGDKLLDLDGDQEQWQKLIQKYKDKNEPIEGLKNINQENIVHESPKLKHKCKELFEKTISQGEEFETNKKHAKDWCTLGSSMLKNDAVQAHAE